MAAVVGGTGPRGGTSTTIVAARRGRCVVLAEAASREEIAEVIANLQVRTPAAAGSR